MMGMFDSSDLVLMMRAMVAASRIDFLWKRPKAVPLTFRKTGC